MTSPIRKPEGRWLGVAGWHAGHCWDFCGTCWASLLLLLLTGGIPRESMESQGQPSLFFSSSFLYSGRQVGKEGV